VQVVSRRRSTDHLSGIWSRGRTGISGFASSIARQLRASAGEMLAVRSAKCPILNTPARGWLWPRTASNSKTEFNGGGGLQTHIRIVPGSLPALLNFGLSLYPRAGAVFFAGLNAQRHQAE
jgi:hypothetical protein